MAGAAARRTRGASASRRTLWAATGAATSAALTGAIMFGATTGAWLSGEEGSAFEQADLAVPGLLVGAIILNGRPRNLVGWALWAGGAVWALSSAAVGYAAWASAGGYAGAVLTAWVAEWAWIPGFILLFVGVPLVFPDGRLPSRRWRPVVAITALLVGLQILGEAFSPGPLVYLSETGGPSGVPDNPFGVRGVDRLAVIIEPVVATIFIPLLLSVVVAMVLRYRKGDATLRAQMRWLLLGIALLATAFVVSIFADAVSDVLFPMAVTAIPAAIGIAVTRYRLYEIDRILNRTLVYATVTAVLTGCYVGLVLIFQPAMRAVTAGSDLAVAGSTLVVAAAFGPVRRRVQHLVDRRFDRARYDAARTIEIFGARLRDAVHLEALRDELGAVAVTTMAPSHVSIWTKRGADDEGTSSAARVAGPAGQVA